MYQPNIRSIHLELSNKCNARCPMCSRTNNERIEQAPAEFTLAKFKQHFSPEFIQQLESFKMCGNFGDPAIAKDCIAIHQYIDECNPTIRLAFHTNGGLRTKTFWKQLGEIYCKHEDRMIVFHIDGLKDTNGIYRADVDYDLAIRNAQSAIATGAKCVWAFIPFMHNEHQIEEAEAEANRLGFYKFAIKISARFEHKMQPFKYKDSKTGLMKAIFPATSSEFNVNAMLENLETPICAAEKRREAYIDARGNVLPCCWYGSVYENNDEFKAEYNKHSTPNLNERPLSDIIQDPIFSGAIKQSWADHSILSKPCYKKCTGKEMHFWRYDGETIPQKPLRDWLDE